MADESSARHLRVLRTGDGARRAEAGDDARREAYWARLQALRAERQRLQDAG